MGTAGASNGGYMMGSAHNADHHHEHSADGSSCEQAHDVHDHSHDHSDCCDHDDDDHTNPKGGCC